MTQPQTAAFSAQRDPSASYHSAGRELLVTDFGAVGDGKTLNTAALQAAIDAAAQARATVVFPPGTYLSGTLALRDNVTLYLAAEATLLASDSLADYTVADERLHPLYRQSLIYARGLKNVGLAGPGVIDGQGAAFPYGAEGINPEDVDTLSASHEKFVRPVLARFVACTNVQLEGITLQNPAHFAVVLSDIDGFHAHGVRVEARANQNGDGFQMHEMRNVFISNCQMSCSDDCLPFFGSAENVVVTNCVLSSRWAAVRFGPGGGGRFHNVAVSNCVIHDCFGCGVKMQQVEGGIFEDMRFSNLVMDNVTGPISLRLAAWKGWMHELPEVPAVGTFRNVSFSGIRARVPENSQPREYEVPHAPGELRQCMNITGLPGHPVEGITLSDIHITYFGGGTAAEAARREIPEMETYYPEYHMFGTLPAYGLYVRHARGLTLRDVTFDVEHADLRPAIVCDDVEGLELDGVRAQGTPEAESLLRFRGVRDAFIHGCRALSACSTFLRVEGMSSTGIMLEGNDLRKADCAVAFSDGAEPECAAPDTPSLPRSDVED